MPTVSSCSCSRTPYPKRMSVLHQITQKANLDKGDTQMNDPLAHLNFSLMWLLAPHWEPAADWIIQKSLFGRKDGGIECRLLFVITSRTRYFIALTLPPSQWPSSTSPLFLGRAKLCRLAPSLLQQPTVFWKQKNKKLQHFRANFLMAGRLALDKKDLGTWKWRSHGWR